MLKFYKQIKNIGNKVKNIYSKSLQVQDIIRSIQKLTNNKRSNTQFQNSPIATTSKSKSRKSTLSQVKHNLSNNFHNIVDSPGLQNIVKEVMKTRRKKRKK